MQHMSSETHIPVPEFNIEELYHQIIPLTLLEMIYSVLIWNTVLSSLPLFIM